MAQPQLASTLTLAGLERFWAGLYPDSVPAANPEGRDRLTDLPPELTQRILLLTISAFYEEKHTQSKYVRHRNAIEIRRQNVLAHGLPTGAAFDQSVSAFDEALSQNADLCIGLILRVQRRRRTLNLISSKIHLLKAGASWAKEEINGNGRRYLVISLDAPYHGGRRRVILKSRDLKFARHDPGCLYGEAAEKLEKAIESEVRKGNLRSAEVYEPGTLLFDVTKTLNEWVQSPKNIVNLTGCAPQFVGQRKKLLEKLKAASLEERLAFARKILARWIERNSVPTTRLWGPGDLPNEYIIRINLRVWWLVGVIPMSSCIRPIGDNCLLTASAVMAHVSRCMALLQRFPLNHPLDGASRAQLVEQWKQLSPVSDQDPLGLAVEKSIQEDTQFKTLGAILAHHRDGHLPGVFSELNSFQG